jgi:hypothetical protein
MQAEYYEFVATAGTGLFWRKEAGGDGAHG